MKLKFYFLMLLIVGAQMAFSQNDFVKVTVGYSRTSVLIGDLNFLTADRDYKGGFSALASYNHPFSKNFYIGAGVGYYNKGPKSRVQIFDENAVFIKEEDVDWDFNYIGMPIYVGFRKGHSSIFYTELGIVTSILTKSLVDFVDISGDPALANARINMTDAVNKFDLSIFSQVGIRKDLNETYAIDFSIGIQQSLTGIGFEDGATGDDRFHTGFSGIFGLIYKLNQ